MFYHHPCLDGFPFLEDLRDYQKLMTWYRQTTCKRSRRSFFALQQDKSDKLSAIMTDIYIIHPWNISLWPYSVFNLTSDTDNWIDLGTGDVASHKQWNWSHAYSVQVCDKMSNQCWNNSLLFEIYCLWCTGATVGSRKLIWIGEATNRLNWYSLKFDRLKLDYNLTVIGDISNSNQLVNKLSQLWFQ